MSAFLEVFMLFKTLSIKKVYHIGTMDISKRSSFNFEGKGLSVSVTPREWLNICKGNISGNNNLLFNPNARFALYNLTNELKEELISYGLNQKFIKEKNIYSYSYYDDEMEMECIEYSESVESLIDEFEDKDGIVKQNIFIATDKMKKQMLPIKFEEKEPFTELFTLFIQAKFPIYDGIWINSDIDVLKYQAPAGTIFDHKLENWKTEIVSDSFLPDLIEDFIPKILTY